MKLEITAELFREGTAIVAHAPALDVSSCGKTDEEAIRALMEAIRLFVVTSLERGTLDRILRECGFVLQGEKWIVPTQPEGWSPDNLIPISEITRRLACVKI